MASIESEKWMATSSITLTLAAAISIAASFFLASACRRERKRLASRVRELEASLDTSTKNAASERRGRVRAQQDLRKALAQWSPDGSKPNTLSSSYPMAPIGIVHSCFTTRNGTPRQPLLVPLSRACLVFDPSRVPAEALKGLPEYSHCWVLYVFHMNTNLEKLWKEPSRSKFKSKVRVPGLKGGKMGVLATRSPHRPCPIGLTAAKVEAVNEHSILLSGVDLVDGTPVLDIKPYLPYSDCIQGARVPKWVKAENALAVACVSFSVDFPSSLSSCWAMAKEHSLYASAEEFQRLIKEVLSWDIRSLSQQSRPHHTDLERERDRRNGSDQEANRNASRSHNRNASSRSLNDITYHLVLEGVNISYRIDDHSNIMVEKATLVSDAKNFKSSRNSSLMWREKLGQQK